MKFIDQLQPALWKEFIDRHFTSPTVIAPDAGDFTFPPSKEFIHELQENFTSATVDKYEHGTTFSSYYVKYNIGGHHGEAIFKTTTTTYPDFNMYDNVEEYEMSFSEND